VTEQSRPNLRNELSPKTPPHEAPEAPKLAVKVDAPVIATLRHHDTCPGIRGRECSCAANLELIKNGTYRAKEKLKAEWMEPTKLETINELGLKEVKSGLTPMSAWLWRVDDGIDVDRQRPNPSGSRTAKPITITEHLPPRWVCTNCGWGGRGDDIGHRCDVAAVRLARRVTTLADNLSPEQRRDGRLRLVIWKDANDVYHLGEELLEDGRIVKTVERDSDGGYDVLLGAINSAIVDLWS
jgi:hypothetical protein